MERLYECLFMNAALLGKTMPHDVCIKRLKISSLFLMMMMCWEKSHFLQVLDVISHFHDCIC